MLSSPKKFLLILLTFVTLIAIAGCAAAPKAGTAATVSRQVPVTRGDLVVGVSVDGNLEMTDYYNLRFAASGEVKKVLVEEGDQVKQGQLLAYLDDTSARLDVKSANNSVQSSLSTLYETVPRLPQFPGIYYDRIGLNPITGKIDYLAPDGVYINPVYQMYYPNASILSSYTWAQEEVARAHELFQSDNYTAAASELYVASADLEACTVILEDAINNPESGLGNTAPVVDDSNYYTFSIYNNSSFAAYYIQELRREVAAIRQAQTDIQKVYELLNQAKYDEARALLAVCLDTVDSTTREVIENINRLKLRNDTTIYGRDMSLYFFNAGRDKLDAAISGIGEGGLYSPQMNNNLRIALHYMELCNGILGSNDYVLQHGLSLKAEQNAKIDLASKLVSLDSTQNNYLNTFIWAPIDGTVVSVGVKEKDV
ncbi:MAG: biotin/lipoyl-binding protein, partial [Dehalococcoidia bacterium]